VPNLPDVPARSDEEMRRWLAESALELHQVSAQIVEHAEELVPGESVGELRSAWSHMNGREDAPFNRLITELRLPGPTNELRDVGLLGPEGTAKLTTLGRLKDRFYAFLNSTPLNRWKRRMTAKAAKNYLEYAAVIIASLKEAFKAVPGMSALLEGIGEFTKLIKLLVDLRLQRGH
jgi:hypothetical protein